MTVVFVFCSIRCSTSSVPKIIKKRGVKALSDEEKVRSIVRFPQVGERGRNYVSTGNDDGGTVVLSLPGGEGRGG